MSPASHALLIGWASCDLTPEEPVLLAGQFHARVSEGVMDPVTATALALEAADGAAVVMVSCDLVAIPDGLRDAVRAELRQALPEMDPHAVFLNATHTHTAPEIRVAADSLAFGGGTVPPVVDADLSVMAPADYVATIAPRIAETVARAWRDRQPGGISYGLGHVVVGHNRRISYYDGVTRMYGNTNDPQFSHIEGYEDHGLNVLATWDADRRLTGLIVNVACPSQVSEQAFQISADYWHETRVELRRRLGDGLFVLPQNSASGDQSPHIQVGKRAEERMWRLMDRTQREDIGARIADAVTAVLPFIERDIDQAPALAHRMAMVPLSRRLLTEADVEAANMEAAAAGAEYERLRAELEAHPEMIAQPRWYVPITSAHRRMRWNAAVAERFARQQTKPTVLVEVHAVRLGEVAFTTNPFEYYLDFGMQIKARSAATQTFLIQHVGSGTYLPTRRAIAGQSYGAVPASTPVGPEGGRELVEWTLAAIAALWEKG
ncbi:MAG: hypothetical protein BWY76_02215 [bacterium ADurb.Bin429]|nr:MAG: hypothetical protein BWY76_02215 [bacterium ADurb.Bin429]